jgi:hypothetical protein
MAGAGKKTFTAGEVLTASDVNTYLMEQSVMVFAGTAARSSAIPTPSDGMVTYNQTNNSLEAYNGTEWINKSGLQLVKKQTIGTGVSSITVSNAFSATYDAYKIIVTGGAGSTAAYLRLAMDGATSGYKSSLVYNNFGTGSISIDTFTSAAFFNYAGSTDTQGSYLNADLVSPFLAKNTIFSSPLINSSLSGTSTGIHPVATSYTGLVITTSTGTLTGGTIYVYGYGI